MDELRAMADLAGEAMILHDERAPDGTRLGGEHEEAFLRALEDLSVRTKISFENALETGDAPWFWSRYARSVTIDIGHAEVAGLDSVEFVRGLAEEIIDMTDYVHMHHNGEFRGGLTDHWPLSPGCRELRALQALHALRSFVTFSLATYLGKCACVKD